MSDAANDALMGSNNKGSGSKKVDDFNGKAKAHQRYWVNDPSGKLTQKGEPRKILVPGATTVLGVLDKPYIAGWANRLGLAGVDSNKARDESANIGTLAHYLIECDLKGETPDLQHFTPYQMSRARNALRGWHEFTKGRHVEPLLIEGRLVSQEHLYGGTIDLLAMVDGVPTLLDFKTSDAVYLEHRSQATSYVKLAQEHGHKVARVYVVRLPKNAEDDDFDAHRLGVARMRDFYWPLFQRCLEIYWLRRRLKAQGDDE